MAASEKIEEWETCVDEFTQRKFIGEKIPKTLENTQDLKMIDILIYPTKLQDFEEKIDIVQEPATEVFTPFLTNGLTTYKHYWQCTDPKRFVSWVTVRAFRAQSPI